jgi:hypothetical protein
LKTSPPRTSGDEEGADDADLGFVENGEAHLYAHYERVSEDGDGEQRERQRCEGGGGIAFKEEDQRAGETQSPEE